MSPAVTRARPESKHSTGPSLHSAHDNLGTSGHDHVLGEPSESIKGAEEKEKDKEKKRELEEAMAVLPA